MNNQPISETEDEYIARVTADLMHFPSREKNDPEWVRRWQSKMRLKYRARHRQHQVTDSLSHSRRREGR